MQTVSSAWKAEQEKNIVSAAYVEVSYKVSDPASEQDSSAADNYHWEHSDVSEVVSVEDKQYKKYVSCEFNSWLLDGTYDLFTTESVPDTGFVSYALSNNNAKFSTGALPTVTINFTRTHTNPIPGIAITWSTAFNEWAYSFRVTAYNGSTVTAQTTVTGNTDINCNVLLSIPEYNRITIEVLEWSFPIHRARIEQITVGLITVFSRGELMGFEQSQYIELLSTQLPKYQTIFSISNVDGKWNPDNPNGVYQYLLEQQEIVVRFGYMLDGAVEWIKGGTFWLSGWETPQNGITAKFTARDLVGLMEDPFIPTSGTYTLKQLAVQALTQANLPTQKDGSVRWVLADALDSISVTIDASNFEYTQAEVLQLCANSALCIMYQDRDGILRVEPLANILSDYVISGFNSYKNAEYEISKPVGSVNVNKGLAVSSTGVSGIEQAIENPLIQNSSVAASVANWVSDFIQNRKTLTGEWRPDVRLDAGDKITVQNKYATSPVFITEVKYNYNGAFSGSYKGRVMGE